MGAYIINVPDTVDTIIYVNIGDVYDGKTYIASQRVEDLTPYTEPDMEQVRKDAYQQGLSDAWDAARTLWNTPNRKEIFGYTVFSNALMSLTGQEVIEKIRQYEQEKEEQIQVGDEVIYNGTTTCVVFSPENDKKYASIIDADGIKYSADHRELTKTGRHFPEIAEVLQKMKES